MNAEPKKSALIRSSGRSNFTGILFLLLLIPFHPVIGLEIPLVWIVLMALAAAMLAYASATLIVASQDLDRYGSLIMYEALLRFAAAGVLLFTSFFFGWWGILIFLVGLNDLFWGIAYCMIVPQATGRSVKQLLFLEDSSEPGSVARQTASGPEEQPLAFKI